MKIAVMSDGAALSSRVPDCFETSPALLVVETDDQSLCESVQGQPPEELAQAVVRSGCEAVVCGPHIGKACFEPIADACITRYNGEGLDVLTAALRADRGTLPIIPEYEGGPGCGSGGGECGECEDGHHHH